MNNWAIFNTGGWLGLIALLALLGSVAWCISCCPTKYVRVPYSCVNEDREKKVFKVLVKEVTRETDRIIYVKFYNDDETVVHKSFVVCTSDVWKKGDRGELHVTEPYARWQGWL